jgi:hypothetical protein
MMDLEVLKRHREEMIREVDQNRLAKSLRKTPRPHSSGPLSALEWELKRISGRLLKFLRTSRKAG